MKRFKSREHRPNKRTSAGAVGGNLSPTEARKTLHNCSHQKRRSSRITWNWQLAGRTFCQIHGQQAGDVLLKSSVIKLKLSPAGLQPKTVSRWTDRRRPTGASRRNRRIAWVRGNHERCSDGRSWGVWTMSTFCVDDSDLRGDRARNPVVAAARVPSRAVASAGMARLPLAGSS